MRLTLLALLLTACANDPLPAPDLAPPADAGAAADLAPCGHFLEPMCAPPGPECIGSDPSGRPLVLRRADGRCVPCGAPDARCCATDGGGMVCQLGTCDPGAAFCAP